MRSVLTAPVLCFFVFCSLPAPGAAQTLRAEALTAPPPAELAPGVRERLADRGVKATAGDVTIELWWVKALPVSKDAAWSGVREGSLVGAVRLSAPYRDIRGRTLKPGVYTLRFGIQPADGDHMGVSPFREFLLLSPAAADTDPEPVSHDQLVELSKQAIGSSHPAPWSIDPPAATEPPLSVRTNDAGHEAVVVEVPTSAGKPLRFGLILVGKIEA
ncbi:MAG TPA: hypothetical protein VNK92_02730 [Vicinamibacterales bacterium]|jgi:hypothetical protein|nr:hypothetical protein [Vicinamibacterales bacterium]